MDTPTTYLRAAAALALLCAASCSEAPPSHPATAGTIPDLRNVSAELGLSVRQIPGAHADWPLPASMGGGVALFDADSDGDLDIYLVNGHSAADGPTGATGTERNALFLQAESGRFDDATASSGLGDQGYGMGVAIGDVDADGDPDLYLTNLGPDRLYANEGAAHFSDATSAAGLGDAGWCCSATFLDYDADGDLDLFVTRYVEFDRSNECHDSLGRRDFCSPKTFPALSDLLYENTGDGVFRDVSARAGIASERAAGLGVVSADFDGDGLLDLYIANDGYANHLWRNAGDGRFTEEAIQRGCALNRDGAPEAGMGVLAEDLDGDGTIDLFMTHLRNESNTLYRNLGSGQFTDATARAGIARPSLPATGFGTVAFDLELDGDLDIVVVNGRVTRTEVEQGAGLPAPWDAYCEANMVLIADGTNYTPVRATGGFEEEVLVSRGLACGDIDADGDLDLVITSIAGSVSVYRNETARSGSWLLVSAALDAPRRPAIGATITLSAGERRWTRSVRRGGSYLSSSPPTAHFGLGAMDHYDSILIRWPDGSTERFSGGQTDRAVECVRGAGGARR